MKCIYCNDDTELTVSDIIPYTLTGAKVRRQFVCHMHNSFTNDNYEKDTIAILAPFRNELGLEERSGAPVRFIGDFSIDVTFCTDHGIACHIKDGTITDVNAR